MSCFGYDNVRINVPRKEKFNGDASTQDTLLEIDLYRIKATWNVHREVAESVRTASIALSESHVVEALDRFTDVLEHECEGHPMALLNRSICYLLLDFPSLAVSDACKYFK
jgi:hypothetical protein